jgi:hypothetical protein
MVVPPHASRPTASATMAAVATPRACVMAEIVTLATTVEDGCERALPHASVWFPGGEAIELHRTPR